jgi:hypothetical protein
VSAPCPRFGFRVRLELAPEVDSAHAHTAFKAFTGFLTSLGLGTRAAGTDRMLSAKVWRDGGQAAHQDLVAIRAWIAQRDEFTRVELGDIVDLSDDD